MIRTRRLEIEDRTIMLLFGIILLSFFIFWGFYESTRKYDIEQLKITQGQCND